MPIATQLPKKIKLMAKPISISLAKGGPRDLCQILVDNMIPEDLILQLRDYMLERRLIVERPHRDSSDEIIEKRPDVFNSPKDPLLRRYGVPDIIIYI